MSWPRSRRAALTISAAVVLAGATAAGTAVAASSASRPAPPVSVSMDGAFTFHACAAGTPAADACLTDHLTGTVPGIGAVTGTFEVHIAFSQAAADTCAPIDKQGSFAASGGSTLTLSAHGMYCSVNSTAAYNYRIVGGTGALAHASGHGQWLVPPPATFSNGSGTGAEFFFGSVRG